MSISPDNSGMHSGTRSQDPNVAALRTLRAATRDYIVVLEAGLAALTDQAIEGKPELAYLRTALAVACGKRGSSFGTPIGIEIMIARMLGESTYSPEEEPTT